MIGKERSHGTALVNTRNPIAITADRLITERSYLIGTVLDNNYQAVRDRYAQLYDGQQLSKSQLLGVLTRKADRGKWPEVMRVISVPWLAGSNTLQDQTFTLLQGEANARVSDPTLRLTLKNLPTTGLPVDLDTTTGDDGGEAGADPSTWEELLGSLPGIIDVITGIAGGANGTDAGAEAARIEEERKAARMRMYVIIGITVALAVGLVVIVIKTARNQ